MNLPSGCLRLPVGKRVQKQNSYRRDRSLPEKSNRALPATVTSQVILRTRRIHCILPMASRQP